MKNNFLLLKVSLAILLAVFAGWITGPEKALFGVPYLKIYHLMGQLFLNALNFVVLPLVSASIITGAAKMGSDPTFNSIGAKAFGFFLLTSLIAALTGLCGYLLFSPKIVTENISFQMPTTIMADIASHTNDDAFDKFSQILFKIVPSNILAAASQGQMLGIICFCILFGIFIGKIDYHSSSIIIGFWNGIYQIMMKITHLVIRALPFGVFGLVAKVVATTGIESISSVAYYFLTTIASLFIFAIVPIPLLLLSLAKVNPILHFRYLAPALFTAFTTSSSVATLPITMECLEKKTGISNQICSFSVPLGTSINMTGGALYLCIASLFIAQSYGVELSVGMIVLVLLMALLTSIGIAGIPSASLISVAIILQTIHVPVEGIGLIMAVDRILDMFRTMVNVLGNATCAVLLASSQGEKVLKPGIVT